MRIHNIVKKTIDVINNFINNFNIIQKRQRKKEQN